MGAIERKFPWQKKATPQLLVLEPRILFDGAAAVVADKVSDQNSASNTNLSTDANSATVQTAQAEQIDGTTESNLLDSSKVSSPISDANQVESAEASSETIAELIAGIDSSVGGYIRQIDSATEIVFIDGAVQGKDVLVAGTRAGVEIFLLGAERNPWEQMSEVIARLHDVQAVHIVSHGSGGDIILGGTNYTAQRLQGESVALQSWQSHLTQNADILVYGCDIGADASGQLLISVLANITQADVAASTDATGSVSFGGDWVLETSTGNVETSIFAVDSALVQYDFALAAPSNTVPDTSALPLVVAPDTNLAFTGGNAITVSDADNNLSSAQISVLQGSLTATAGTGSATIGGSGTSLLTITGSRDNINAALATLIYRGSSAYHGTDTLTLVSTDATSLAATSTVAISVDAVLPTLSSVVSTKTVLENAVASQLTSAATISDSDSSNFNGGEIVVTGLDAADVLSIATGSGTGAIRRDGSSLQYYDGTSWVAIGTVAGGVGSSLHLSFTSTLVTATVAESVVKAITFYNNSDNPTTSRTLAITVFDSDGGPSTAQNITVNVTPVNDAPVISLDAAKTVIENDPASLLTPAATITDVDSTSLNGGVLTVSGLATGDVLSISSSTAWSNGVIRLTGSNVELGGASSNSWTTIATLSGGSGGTALTITFSSASATPVVAESVLRAITFYNNSDTPVASRTLAVTLSDASSGSGGLTSVQKTILVNVTAVNDAPVLTVASSLTVNEQTSTSLASTATVTDADSANFNAGVLTISGLDASDVITISASTAWANGAIRLNGSNVELGGASSNTWSTIASIAGGSGSTLRITFNSAAVTPAVAQNVIRALIYSNTANNPVASHTLNVTIGDGSGALSATQQIVVTLTPVNDVPLPSTATTMSMSLPNATSVALTGQQKPAVGAGFLLDVFFQGGIISDPDGTSTSNLGVAITGIPAGSKLNALWYTQDGGSTWSNITSASSTSALLLANTSTTRVYFEMSNSATTGTAYASLTLRAWDKSTGTAGTTGNNTTTTLATAVGAGDITLNITLLAAGVNPPTNTLPAYSATEDTAMSLYTSSSSKILIADTDHVANGTEVYTITLSVGSGNGILSATSSGGVTITGSGTNSLTLSGTLES